jgi:hypothetical protein
MGDGNLEQVRLDERYRRQKKPCERLKDELQIALAS